MNSFSNWLELKYQFMFACFDRGKKKKRKKKRSQKNEHNEREVGG